MTSKWKDKVKTAVHSGVAGLRKFAYAEPDPRHRNLPDEPKPQPRPKIGVALGGGFARGAAHVGVLKVLCENQIPIDALSGVSAGSVVGAAFACGIAFNDLIEAARAVRWKSFARWTVSRMGLATNGRMDPFIRSISPCTTFEQLRIPLAVVATDITTGEGVVFQSGELIPPVRASCSVPGMFTPVKIDGRLLVDGGMAGSVPVAALRGLGADLVVAVHLKNSGSGRAPTNLVQVIEQTFEIGHQQIMESWRQASDVIIEPDVSSFAWDDFARVDEMVDVGEAAAHEMLPALRALVERAPAPMVALPETGT